MGARWAYGNAVVHCPGESDECEGWIVASSRRRRCVACQRVHERELATNRYWKKRKERDDDHRA